MTIDMAQIIDVEPVTEDQCSMYRRMNHDYCQHFQISLYNGLLPEHRQPATLSDDELLDSLTDLFYTAAGADADLCVAADRSFTGTAFDSILHELRTRLHSDRNGRT